MMTKQITTERPLLSPEKRNAYLGAITELVGSVGLHESTPIHAGNFCEKHGLKPSFLDALRDLDGLVMDFSKPCTDGMIYFRKTPTLYQIEPEAVLRQMRATGSVKGKEAKRNEVMPETPEVALTSSESIDHEIVAKEVDNPEADLTGGLPLQPVEAVAKKISTSIRIADDSLPGSLETTSAPGVTSAKQDPECSGCKQMTKRDVIVSGADVKAAYERATRVYDDLRGMVVSTEPTEKPVLTFRERLANINTLYNQAAQISG